MTRLNGKVAILTGATGGIGRATALSFVREGARVVLVDREASSLRELAGELGPNAAYVVGDVSNEADAQRYVQTALERFERLDILFANAGIEGTVAPIAQLPVEALEQCFAVNVRGVFFGLKHAMPAMAKTGGGSIVVTSSIAGLIGSPGLAAYVTSKHAVLGLVRTAALEGAAIGVRVNALNPGPIENRMMRGIEGQVMPGQAEAVKQLFVGQIPLARYGTNEEIARFALFLASDEASFCTGGVYVADGGFTAH